MTMSYFIGLILGAAIFFAGAILGATGYMAAFDSGMKAHGYKKQ